MIYDEMYENKVQETLAALDEMAADMPEDMSKEMPEDMSEGVTPYEEEEYSEGVTPVDDEEPSGVTPAVKRNTGFMVKMIMKAISAASEEEAAEGGVTHAMTAGKAGVSGLGLLRLDTGAYYPVDQEVRIGRSLENDIVIAAPAGKHVSRLHASITIEGDKIILQDFSSNGTFVNGTKIISSIIEPGDVIKFADIEFEVVQK